MRLSLEARTFFSFHGEGAEPGVVPFVSPNILMLLLIS